MANGVELGCGLVAIGRTWGTTPEVPSDEAAAAFLEAAYQLGIRYLDTAPSYGSSEERLGASLATLDAEQRDLMFVATKVGERWDEDAQAAVVDHTEDGMKRSIDQSLRRLGTISLLQLHKSSPALLQSDALDHALEYARNQGIASFGASVSDLETALLAIDDGRFASVQFPYNVDSPQFREAIERAIAQGVDVVINRPFRMGKVPAEAGDKTTAMVEAFRFILTALPEGTILTGTSNAAHLRENLEAFHQA